jgi:hypothetical protein
MSLRDSSFFLLPRLRDSLVFVAFVRRFVAYLFHGTLLTLTFPLHTTWYNRAVRYFTCVVVMSAYFGYTTWVLQKQLPNIPRRVLCLRWLYISFVTVFWHSHTSSYRCILGTSNINDRSTNTSPSGIRDISHQ